MNNYYYLMASLPSLDNLKDGQLPMTKDEFLHAVRPAVDDKVFGIVCDILDGKETKSSLLSQYNTLKRTLNTALVALRAERLGLEDDKYKLSIPIESAVLGKLRDIVDNPNPLKAEYQIIDLYAKSLSNLSTFSRFNKRELVSYTIKFKLLLDSKRFDNAKGEEEFDTIFDSLKFRAEEIN